MGTHNDCQESNIIFQQKLREKIESTFSQLDDIGDDTVKYSLTSDLQVLLSEKISATDSVIINMPMSSLIWITVISLGIKRNWTIPDERTNCKFFIKYSLRSPARKKRKFI